MRLSADKFPRHLLSILAGLVILLSACAPVAPTGADSVSPSQTSPAPQRSSTPTPTSAPTATPTRLPDTLTPSPLPPSPTPTLAVYALQSPPVQGEGVLRIQQRLLELGYGEVGVPGGVFDEQTEAAVRHFQWYNRLDVSGIVDATTRELLFSASPVDNLRWSQFAFPGRELSPSSGQLCDDYALQARLSDLGYLQPGEEEVFTNVYGPLTEAAVRQFQAANRLPVTGVVTWQVWNVLFHPLAVRAGEEPAALPERVPYTTRIYAVGANPSALAYDGARIWVLNREDDALQAIDPVSGYVSAPLRVGQRDCLTGYAVEGAQALIFAAGRLWVSLGSVSGAVQSISPTSGVAAAPIFTGGGSDASGFGFGGTGTVLGFDGLRLWVAGGDDTARAVDLSTRRVLARRTIGWLASGVMVFDGSCMWVSRDDGGLVSAFDPGLNTCRSVGDYPWLPAGSLAVGGGRVWSAGPYGLFYKELSGIADASDYPLVDIAGAGGAAAFDGAEHIWVALPDSGAVQAVDVLTLQISEPLPVGNGPSALLFAGGRLWVANAEDNSVLALAPDPAWLPTRVPPAPAQP